MAAMRGRRSFTTEMIKYNNEKGALSVTRSTNQWIVVWSLHVCYWTPWIQLNKGHPLTRPTCKSPFTNFVTCPQHPCNITSIIHDPCAPGKSYLPKWSTGGSQTLLAGAGADPGGGRPLTPLSIFFQAEFAAWWWQSQQLWQDWLPTGRCEFSVKQKRSSDMWASHSTSPKEKAGSAILLDQQNCNWHTQSSSASTASL
jgi:hypothetical protein